MRSRRLSVFFLAILILVATVIPGCTSKSPEFTVAIGDEPAAFDPQLAYDTYTLPIVNAVFEGLYRRDKNGLPIPAAAKDHELSPDGLTYTFHLRDSTTWADGTPVKADDFKVAWLRALNPQPSDHAPSYTANLLYCIKGAEEYNSGNGKPEDVGIKVQDDKTLVVELVKPTPYFLDLVCNGVYMPVNKSFYDKQPVENNIGKYGSDAETVLGNGPFRISEWKHDSRIVLERNDKYWNKENVAMKKVVFKIIRDASAAFTEFKAGEIDMTDITAEQREQCVREGITVNSYDRGATVYLDFNNKDTVLSNVNIRRALSMSLDREEIIKNVLKDDSKKALGYINPVIQGEKDLFRKEAGDLIEDNNIDKARKLYKKGLEELKMTGPQKITVLSDDMQESKQQAQIYQEMWKKNLGIDVEISVMPFDAIQEKLFNNDYQVAIMIWGSDYNDALGFLESYTSENPNNFSRYSNKKYDELVDKSRTELDSSKRIKWEIEAEKILLDEMALCPLYFMTGNYVVKSKVKDLIRRNSAIQDMDFYWAHME
jgi:oligopeptide transport system substrate-binding protein